jgi:TetR/AcrR family transcriptional repressor of lmrAB and yxaGH operons
VSTGKGERTKQRMVATTAALMQRQGISATGLSEIVEGAQAPKGSLYFHFPGGKEELALAALQQAAQQLGDGIAAVLAQAPTPADGVAQLVTGMAAGLEHSGYARGCPLATTALETAHDSDVLAAACAAGFASWHGHIAHALRRDGFTPAVARDRATLALSALEGALILARAQRDTAPLHTVAKQLQPLLRKEPS